MLRVGECTADDLLPVNVSVCAPHLYLCIVVRIKYCSSESALRVSKHISDRCMYSLNTVRVGKYIAHLYVALGSHGHHALEQLHTIIRITQTV